MAVGVGPSEDRTVRIYEVGPRDGLQNEARPIATADKLRFIELLAAAGLTEIEVTSFVRPAAIPQLADADEVVRTLRPAKRPGRIRYPVLVPNEQGMARAEAAGARALAVFTAASDAFTRHNIGMSIAESLTAFRPVLGRAASLGWWRRAYVSTAFGCPYVGAVEPAAAVGVGLALAELGAEEICFGDTIGVAVPDQVEELAGLALAAGLPPDRIAFHFHDTRGTALANVAAGLRAGIRAFDASTGGTGGCPRAGRRRQPGDRGPGLLPGRLRLAPRGPSRGRPRGRSIHRRVARATARLEGRPGGRLGPGDGRRDGHGPAPSGARRRLATALLASAPWTVPSSC